ncbi:MAG: ketopantoate reductase C-terminal domain-containing protein, partial [Pseudomonadota bacterium]
WSKFVLFSGVSGVTAAARCRIGDILDSPELTALFRTLVAETAALARARRVAVADDVEARVFDAIQRLPREMRASTAIDLEKGAALETEWINGAVARLSAEAGLSAPANQAISAVLSLYKDGPR